jgi:hypothetical protein
VLRDGDFCAPLVQIFNDRIGVKSLVGDQAAKFDVFDQRCNADRIEALTGQQNEPHKVAQGIRQREDFGGHSAF